MTRLAIQVLAMVLALTAATVGLPAQESDSDRRPRVLHLSGELSPREAVRVYSRVSGVIVKLAFRENWPYKAGDVLAEIDPVEYELDVQEARAKLESVESHLAAMEAGGRAEERVRAAAEVTGAEAVMKTARMNLDRQTNLFGKKAISQAELDNARRDFEVAEARLVGARKSLALVTAGPRLEERRAQKAEVERARAELNRAELRLSYTRVRAPFDGGIGQRLVDEGAYVLAASSPQASALAVYSNIRTLKAVLDIPEKEMPYVRLGAAARLSVQAAQGCTFPATVSNLYPYVDPKTRSGKLELEVPNQSVRLLPGMFVTAQVDCAATAAGSATETLAGRLPGIGSRAVSSSPPTSRSAIPDTPEPARSAQDRP